MFILYNLLLTLLAPLWVPWMLFRAWRRKEGPDWNERTGKLKIPPRGDRRRIWVHAVSVGEVVAAQPVLRELRKVLPEYEIVLSTTTSSGHRTAREGPEGLFDHLMYFPVDVARFQLAAVQRVRPDAVAIMETELWMNLLWAAKVFDAATLLMNGRISDRSVPRAKLVRFFYRALLRNVDRCLMQTEKDAARIQALGARSAEVLGNCKFDQAAESVDADPARRRAELGLPEGTPVVVVGSPGGEEEERLVIEAVRRGGLEKICVIHAPRHMERADALAEAARRAFGSVARRSRGERGRYLVLDTYGELAGIYSVADVAVVGGGFARTGGQNILQPLALGKPVLHGPHMANFREVAPRRAGRGASEVCATADELAEALERLLGDASLRMRMGESARRLVEANLGASRRYAEAIAAAAAQAAELLVVCGL